MEDILPEDILRYINDLVPHDVPPYLDALTEAMAIATETGVTILQRRRQERAMRVSLRGWAQVNERFHMALEDLTNDEDEMVRAALYGAYSHVDIAN